MDTLLVFLFSLLVILFLSWLKIPNAIWRYYRMCQLLKPVPGWPTHWLYGNLHQKNQPRYDIKLHDWVKENGHKISKEWLGPGMSSVNIHHPDVLKKIIKTPKAFEKYQLLDPWLGQGLLIAGGKRWARNRRLLTGAFHFDILKPYIQVYNECTDILINKWMGHVTSGEPVLVYKTISQLTLDILLRCSFSYNSHCQEQEVSPYIKAVMCLADLTLKRSLSFSLMISNNIYLYCTPQGWKCRQALKIVHGHAENVIRDRKKALGLEGISASMKVNMEDVLSTARKGRKYLDFLDILLTARDEDGCGLTDSEIRCEVDTFMFEGYDTTAHGLSWTLYCLAKYPEHQEKCREEINEVLGNRNHLEYEDLSKLKYTQWCIKESLRLHPPVYIILRQLTEDTELAGYLIPKESYLTVRLFNIHRNTEFWKDPEAFDPLRFHPDNIEHQHPYAYVPFSAGPRNCIGQNFAMNEERVVIASIIRKFKLRLVVGHEVETNFGILLHLKNDVKVSIETV